MLHDVHVAAAVAAQVDYERRTTQLVELCHGGFELRGRVAVELREPHICRAFGKITYSVARALRNFVGVFARERPCRIVGGKQNIACGVLRLCKRKTFAGGAVDRDLLALSRPCGERREVVERSELSKLAAELARYHYVAGAQAACECGRIAQRVDHQHSLAGEPGARDAEAAPVTRV